MLDPNASPCTAIASFAPLTSRQEVLARHHRRVHPRFDLFAVLLGDGQQLDHIPEFACEPDIEWADVMDALDGNVREAHCRSKCELDEQRQLVRRIDAVDIERRVRFRQPLVLRLTEHGSELTHRAASSC